VVGVGDNVGFVVGTEAVGEIVGLVVGEHVNPQHVLAHRIQAEFRVNVSSSQQRASVQFIIDVSGWSVPHVGDNVSIPLGVVVPGVGNRVGAIDGCGVVRTTCTHSTTANVE
jgi:hypothetical protein